MPGKPDIHPGSSEAVKEARRAFRKRHEDAFFAGLKFYMIPTPVREFVFFPGRRWRFDFAWPEAKLFVEIDGGIWARGRHSRPSGIMGDMEKFNAAAMLGWLGLHFTPEDVKSNHAHTMTIEFLRRRGKMIL